MGQTRRVIFIKTETKRNEKGMEGSLYLPSRDFEVLGDVKKNAFGVYCHNLLNTTDCNSYKLMLFFYFMYSIVHIFDICQAAAPASVRK